ncbi:MULTISPECIES: hypothetical protein [unclassified Sporolactobacillus]|uniref:hypothetical protein n=1 Tax=unclassified Sporolactobacillus TaxID=2628533 RepID=UPI002368719D|nr:hypothetical protein [Sporolactobacillus sp. CQH2019]MDD9149446.1 hypothetical protein [Sporolactobacillus sp. CQH2019]
MRRNAITDPLACRPSAEFSIRASLGGARHPEPITAAAEAADFKRDEQALDAIDSILERHIKKAIKL